MRHVKHVKIKEVCEGHRRARDCGTNPCERPPPGGGKEVVPERRSATVEKRRSVRFRRQTDRQCIGAREGSHVSGIKTNIVANKTDCTKTGA